MNTGNICLVLNAHLPFVRHPEYPRFLEENWLFEAISETYLPLLRIFRSLERDGIPFRLTMSFSPTLTSMLSDTLLQDRYRNYLDLQGNLAEKELDRTQADEEEFRLASLYHRLIVDNRRDFDELYQGQILRGFAHFQKQGNLEIITSTATHAFLPLYQGNLEAVEAQIALAVDTHEAAFSKPPKGIWLPECGYFPGLDGLLKKYGLNYFFSSAHGFLYGDTFPRKGVYSPLMTPAGVYAFGRDLQSTNAVWSLEGGYPGDPVYRDFYRDIGFDLPLEYIGPYIQDDGVRVNTGFKYYAVTGKTDEKKLYDPQLAAEKVKEHVDNFLYCRLNQIERINELSGDPKGSIVVCPYDAELFGHWWFEGPQWIEGFLRSLAEHGELAAVTPSEYLLKKYPVPQSRLFYSSWGSRGYGEVWLDGKNDWIYRHLHHCEEKMVEIAKENPKAKGLIKRALNQAARELVLAQSSDWAFIMTTETAVPYAKRRTREHIHRFQVLYDQIKSRKIHEDILKDMEWKDAIFQEIEYTAYL